MFEKEPHIHSFCLANEPGLLQSIEGLDDEGFSPLIFVPGIPTIVLEPGKLVNYLSVGEGGGKL